LLYTERFKRSYDDAPETVRRAFERRAGFLLVDIRHPSLRAKRYDERHGIWQARVNRDWRFYFTIEDDIIYLLDIIPHPK
jgi:mRNA-degrading endonuclease RelE of RelBE toxin-antitoxin system